MPGLAFAWFCSRGGWNPAVCEQSIGAPSVDPGADCPWAAEAPAPVAGGPGPCPWASEAPEPAEAGCAAGAARPARRQVRPF